MRIACRMTKATYTYPNCVVLIAFPLQQRLHERASMLCYVRGAGKPLARPRRKQARKHVRDARDFSKIEKRAVIKFLFLQGKALKEIHAILTETLACFIPGRAKDLSAPLYVHCLVPYDFCSQYLSHDEELSLLSSQHLSPVVSVCSNATAREISEDLS